MFKNKFSLKDVTTAIIVYGWIIMIVIVVVVLVTVGVTTWASWMLALVEGWTSFEKFAGLCLAAITFNSFFSK